VSRSSRHWLFPLLVAVVGCGSRSGLSLAGETGVAGNGGAATGGTVATGGDGGTGAIGGTPSTGGTPATGGVGGATTCTAVSMDGAPIQFESSGQYWRHAPHFAFSDDSSASVGVVAFEMPAESPGPVAGHLRMTAIQPWQTWPSTLGGGAQSSFVAGQDQFAFDRGKTPNTLAMAWPATPAPPASQPQGLFFSDQVTASGGNASAVLSLALTGPTNHVVRFVRESANATLVGFEAGDAGYHALHLTRVAKNGMTSSQTFVGCATTDVDADAIAVSPNAFFVAYSTSRAFGACLNDAGIDTPAHRILMARFGAGNSSLEQLPVDIDLDDEVSFVRLLPRTGGAWLVWQYKGVNAEVPPPVMLWALDDTGAPVAPSVPVLDGGAAYTRPAFASLGNRLAMAWLDTSDPSSSVRLRLLTEIGIISNETMAASPVQNLLPELELFASPGGDQLLLGWSEYGAGLAPESRVARFCVPP
jgi:hypothetical protein